MPRSGESAGTLFGKRRVMTQLPATGDDARSDEDLVAMLANGEAEEALAVIDRRYGRRLYHFVHGMVRDSHLAHDVTQEVLGKVLSKHQLYRQGTNFRAWLFEVARNQALSSLRSRQRMPKPMSSLKQIDGDEPTAWLEAVPCERIDRSLEEEEFMAALAKAIEELPEHYQSVFDLCVRQGKPYQEAGAQLGIPTGTVAIRIMRARKRLFGTLSRHLDRLRRPPACFQ